MNDILKRLDASILSGRAMHAYLLTGNDPDMTDSAARRAASLMLYSGDDTERLKIDPDYMEYSGNISISEFRDVIRPEIYRETYSKAGRIVVFRQANLLSQMVQNAMLKVLEEPPENTHFILTGNEYGILPTIRSRCMIIRCSIPSSDEVEKILIGRGADASEARKYAAMSGNISARAIRLYEDADFREFRSGAVLAMISAMRSKPDFKWTKVKRDRTDWSEAGEFLLLTCHDLLKISCGMEPEHTPDLASELKAAGKSFTIGEIGCIINELTELAQRLTTNIGGGAAFDRLFAQIASIKIRK